jgi:arginyl-tRNA synthetase
MYASTDLAALRQRANDEHADRIIYVTDVRQHDHFEQCFTVARKAGWVPDSVSLEHVGFGMILGPNRKPFATREGGTVKLVNVLDEAMSRAAAAAKNDEGRAALSEAQREENARVIGIAAVKYADLSHNPSSDYVFDWDTMLALEGNTAPYMLYAYARIRSIGRKGGIDYDALPVDLPLLLEHESEVALAKQLLLFPGVVNQVAEELRPHHLTDYLYSLSKAFSTFYDRERGVRVINAESEALRLSRLRLCDLTARALKLGLGLLGISVLEQM